MGWFAKESSSGKLTRSQEKNRRGDSKPSQGSIPTLSGGGFYDDRPYGVPQQYPSQSERQYQTLDPGARGPPGWDSGPGGMKQRDERENRDQRNSYNRTVDHGPQSNNTTSMHNSSGGPRGHGDNSEAVRDGSPISEVIVRPPSLRSLRERYIRTVENSETFRTRYSDVIFYVQALLTRNGRLDTKWKEKDEELEHVFTKLLSLIESIYPDDVEVLRENGLTGSRILEFVLESYLGNSNRVINLVGQKEDLINQIAAANRSVHLAEQNLNQVEEFRRTERYQHGQAIKELNESNRRTLEEQHNKHETAMELKQRSHTKEMTTLKTNHKQEIDGLNTGHAEEIQNLNTSHAKEIQSLTNGHATEIENLTTRWNSQAAEFEATISRLQIALLRPVDSFEPLMDGDAENRLEDLRHLVRALARTSMEGVDPDLLGEAFGQTSLIQSGKKQGRKYILESVLWAILVDGFFAHPFSAFGDHGGLLSTTWTQLFETDSKQRNSGFIWPKATEYSENWRYTTCEALQRALTKPNSEKHVKESHETHLVTVADNLAGAITKVSSKPVMSQVEHIVDKANSLALKFSVQRCRLQLFTTTSGETISTSATEMYDILNQSDDESGYEGIVALAVMPGLRKAGDAKGASLDKVSFLRSAAVYLKTWS